MRKIWAIILLSGGIFGFTSAAYAGNEWYNAYGVLVSNTCNGNSTGFIWNYPVYAAQPVGTACRLPSGEFGTVG